MSYLSKLTNVKTYKVSSATNLELEANGNVSVYLKSDGNVGFNQTDPQALIHVTDTTANGGGIIKLTVDSSGTSDNLGRVHFGNTTDSNLAMISANADGTTDSGYLSFWTEPTGGSLTERVRILSNGVVVLGTITGTVSSVPVVHIKDTSMSPVPLVDTNTSVLVEKNGNNYLTIATPNTNTGGLVFADSDSSAPGYITYNHSSNAFQFVTNSSSGISAHMNNSGNWTLGGAGALNNYRLHLDGGSSSVYMQFVNDTTGRTSSDGFLLGIDPSGSCYIDSKDNGTIFIHQGGSAQWRIAGGGSGDLVSYGNNIYQDVGNTTFTISGGDSATSGANIVMFGGSHGVSPSQFEFRQGTITRARIGADGDFGVGVPATNVANYFTIAVGGTTQGGAIDFRGPANNEMLKIRSAVSGGIYSAYYELDDNSTASSGGLHIFKFQGTERFRAGNGCSIVVTNNNGLSINRLSSDGNLIEFFQDSSLEGTISVSGTTVTYGSFTGSHWSQLSNSTREEIPRGTVMSSIDEMCEWEEEDNEQLARCKISNTIGDKSVYGVFMGYDDSINEDGDHNNITNDMKIISLGAYVIRVTGACKNGDLLESNGDGTAKVQDDDIMRSSTIGKVTVGSSIEEEKLVPCVLYCG